jgi:hypothetical protein
MIEGRIRMVFDTMQAHDVQCLLMGGQACVLYGAAEFSKDIDFVVLAGDQNIERVRAAMRALRAEIIAVPPFDPALLDLGLAVHFRCQAPGVEGLRVDLMTKLRGVDPFPDLWERRFTIGDGRGVEINLLCVRDLVAAKKTQRDKDWPMIQRLMEVRYLSGGENPPPEEVSFWFEELRTPELLIDSAKRFPQALAEHLSGRPLLALAKAGNTSALDRALVDEMLAEKEIDRQYWLPLKARLGDLRRRSRKD